MLTLTLVLRDARLSRVQSTEPGEAGLCVDEPAGERIDDDVRVDATGASRADGSGRTDNDDDHLSVAQTEAPAAGAVECYERFVGAPVNERGIQCPGEPAIWKSYTFASSDIGYYTETVTTGNGRAQVRLGYRDADGRVAVAIMDCTAGGCTVSYWNGVPFPFQG